MRTRVSDSEDSIKYGKNGRKVILVKNTATANNGDNFKAALDILFKQK